MGLDFTALIHYAGPTADLLQAVARLERGEEHPALAEVVTCGLRYDFAFAKRAGQQAFWRSSADYEQRLARRPALPFLEACLDLPSDFSLTFGQDAVCVYHMLRWMFFVREPEWQRVMLMAIRWFCELFRASDCIVTNDGHPSVLAFQSGATFREALQVADVQGEGEVPSIGDLFIDKGYAEELAFVGPGGELLAIPLWDTHGYWRFRSSAAQTT
jgi:hypothetical protein